MSQRTLFLTGAAGFIGFHLAQHLHRRGDRVIGYDNFNDYYSVSLKRHRARRLVQLGIPIIEGDVCDSDSLSAVLQKNPITHFVHLAAQAGVRYARIAPEKTLRNNIDGFLSVLEWLRHHPEIPLVYASSSSVYGWNTHTPFAIEDPTDQPASLYGASKKANELMAHAYHKMFGISMTGLRYFTVYGPWGRPDMAYWKFTEAILAGKAIDLYNEGIMRRDFTYIDDIVAGTAAAIDNVDGYSLFNLGNNRPISLLRFVEIVEEAIGKKAVKNFLPMQQGDVPQTCAAIELSAQKLGFQPTTPLEEGIPQFVQWYIRIMIEKSVF